MDVTAVGIAAAKVGLERDADVFLLNSPFDSELTKTVISELAAGRTAKNVVLVVVSYGGAADQAYRIARALQTKYEHFTAIVPGPCKSAGTLCVLGAHELVFGELGELGPLDVQYAKKDEIQEFTSGLVVTEALRAVRDDAYRAFEQTMLSITSRSAGRISFKLAAELATQLAARLYEPLFRQIDPLLLGDLQRSMTIAMDYGKRLMPASRNFTQDSLETLATSYPSHDFVIDMREAQGLFRNVRSCTDAELELIHALGDAACDPVDPCPTFSRLTTLSGEKTHETSIATAAASGVPQSGAGGDSEHSQPAAGARPEPIVGHRARGIAAARDA